MSQYDATYLTGENNDDTGEDIASIASSERTGISLPPAQLLSSVNLQGPVSWKQEPLAAPTRRGWDWIYHSLWMASDGAKAACKVNVPSTVLFHAGEPRRWIQTDDNGRAVRRQFPQPPKSSGGGRSIVREIRLRGVWDGLCVSEKMRRQGVGLTTSCCRLVWRWWKEFLDVDTEHTGPRSWTSQLIALQGYVHATSTSEGACNIRSN